MVAYICFKKIESGILNSSCLINSNDCIEIKYFKKNNSVLAFVNTNNYIFWFNDNTAWVYVDDTGYQCKDPNFEPAYKLTIQQLVAFECILSVKNVQKLYKDVQPIYIYIRSDNLKFDCFDLYNLLISENIIKINK